MSAVELVEVTTSPPGRFREILGERFAEIEAGMEEARRLFTGRVVWHVNSTARGGGVAELLQTLLGYARGAGVDARWAVIGGDPAFFTLTKRIHNFLHGSAGDGGPLGEEERRAYERTFEAPARELGAMVRERDVVYLHDPQTAGMIRPLLETGASVVWRCHVGVDEPNELARAAWDFLRPYVADADALVFSRRQFVWDGLDRECVWVVAPSIDAFSAKNEELEPPVVSSILRRVGLADGSAPDTPYFTRRDGSPGRVDRPAVLHQDGLIPAEAPLVTQVSRWDRLKDPIGVLRGFSRHLGSASPAHLLLAGPEAGGVTDDPEGAAVLADVIAERDRIAPGLRSRIHLARLPMDDLEENAAMVNAIQRRSDVVVQKSLAEGFGLTVSEAMWKSRAVIASRRGGIQDQIEDGVSGVLLDDPADLRAFGDLLGDLLGDDARRGALGAAARDRVEERYLGTRHLIEYLGLLRELLRRKDGDPA